ncbi:MAG: hypothetical protein CO156_00320 [Candidatus Pacebacteria bacterium CG_4_9_14_3_um_filter_40_12]|nr:MAG: hypothetical protein COU64_01055 [Candidatus Pacebacteria bacterium CG10_big_fil_rev_8_21_14_0_10_40_26]PIZ78469.1 MAG: hypothetical protein COY01_04435 [Candidatus Pacebacteria bacterium CG_4_10_14_0_2_um_filter_40_20]PJA69319.1 MAG: hypothetical protein CO156_00320 [Candidatus Pacebacteria bacterium CG_4_9_14_3_um_filter_40_12]PJC42002.1 MAG: hypothetical protein CO041_01875 [Candidatus Pacebacteria bacterium CG_4_9_14_0_2_um_filter_40_15]
MKTVLLLLHVILPIIGIVDSSFITYEEIMGIVPPCGNGFDCGAVLTSKYAHIGPVPLAAIGFMYYLTLFILGSLLVLEVDTSKWFPKKLRAFTSTQQLYTTLTTFGAAFSLYLVFLMGIVIKGWCLYCLISAITSATLFALSWYYFSKTSTSSHTLLKTISHKIVSVLYTNVLKPILFLIDPEIVHNSFSTIGNLLGSSALLRWKTKLLFEYHSATTPIVRDGILFPNKLGLAAGFDYNGEMAKILGPVGFGFHTIGTVTFQPYAGNPKPRLGRLPESKALIVNKGLKTLGAPTIANKLAGITFTVPVGISIASTNTHFDTAQEQLMDIVKGFVVFEKSSVNHSYYELNISCPNTFGGEPFTSPERLEQLLTATDALHLSRPLYIKMPIDQSKKETLQLLAVADTHAVQGVIFGNLTKDKNNPDVTPSERKIWASRKGNLSGKPTFARSNALIRLTREHFYDRFTIIGLGGVFDTETAQSKLDAGADLIQLITGMVFGGPQVIGTIVRELDLKSK